MTWFWRCGFQTKIQSGKQKLSEYDRIINNAEVHFHIHSYYTPGNQSIYIYLLILQVWYLKLAGRPMCFISVLCFYNVLFKENPPLDFYDLLHLIIMYVNWLLFSNIFQTVLSWRRLRGQEGFPKWGIQFGVYLLLRGLLWVSQACAFLGSLWVSFWYDTEFRGLRL